jgi:hypothetical protein
MKIHTLAIASMLLCSVICSCYKENNEPLAAIETAANPKGQKQIAFPGSTSQIAMDSIYMLSDSLQKVYWNINAMLEDVTSNPPPGSWVKCYKFDIDNIMLLDLDEINPPLHFPLIPLSIYWSSSAFPPLGSIASAWDLKYDYQNLINASLSKKAIGKPLYLCFIPGSQNDFIYSVSDELPNEDVYEPADP